MRHNARWNQEVSYDETIEILLALARPHAALAGEQGRIVTDLLDRRDFSALCDFDISYSDCTVFEAGHLRQALAFFTKLESLELGQDKKANAIKKFKEAERDNEFTNEIFLQRAQGLFQFEPWVEQALMSARHKIADVLGEPPKFADLKYRFGNGATTLTKKRDANVRHKLSDGISVSSSLFPYASRILEELPHIAMLHSISHSDVEVRGDYDVTVNLVEVRVTEPALEFARKNAKIYRVISKQPSLDGMVQNALGDHIAKRLLRVGLDISDQGKNQKLALEGSLTGAKATLDLTSASDTITTGLVTDLLPIDWLLTLAPCRADRYWLDGKLHFQHMFSSMGNGFTFPLETLIFWALAQSVDNEQVVVYGDDIICSTRSATRVMQLLEVVGFKVNRKKSFWSGPFRESCGADYLRGMDIRPCYVKDNLTPAKLFILHNFYVRRGDHEGAARVLPFINDSLRIYGPDGFGDGHLLGDWVPRRHKRWKSHGYGGVIFDTFTEIGRRDFRYLTPGDRVLPLYSIYASPPAEDIVPERPGISNYLRRLRFQTSISPEAIQDRVSPVDGSTHKVLTLPGVKGYKRISIYALTYR